MRSGARATGFLDGYGMLGSKVLRSCGVLSRNMVRLDCELMMLFHGALMLFLLLLEHGICLHAVLLGFDQSFLHRWDFSSECVDVLFSMLGHLPPYGDSVAGCCARTSGAGSEADDALSCSQRYLLVDLSCRCVLAELVGVC